MSKRIEARISKLTSDIEARPMAINGSPTAYSAFREIARIAEQNAVAAYEREWLEVIASDLQDPARDRERYCTEQREAAIQRLLNSRHHEAGAEQGLRNVINFLETYIKYDLEDDFPEAG